ncbi:MAG: anhydro-N-acetylmuramic acid kinase [Saprospiraceae bacterium]
MIKSYDNKVILGLMSGTSLDGLDIIACRFKHETKAYNFEILAAETIEYAKEWKHKLSQVFHYSELEVKELDIRYAEFISDCIINFNEKYHLSPDFIGSHGHTVFHKPNQAYTLQIGNGKIIKKLTNISTVSNFRKQDMMLGGQGAPLVPIGDKLLFSEFDFCLNLGGFANLSWSDDGIRKACDISPCNILLNMLANRLGIEYDHGGELASKGTIIDELCDHWNTYPFYKQESPKSLGREWFENNFLKDLNNPNDSIQDLLRTGVEHIATQISHWINEKSNQISQKILVTGGGTFNNFLLDQIRLRLKENILLSRPDPQIINYKEALIFAFLAFLRVKGSNNVLASVTGASQDHSSGDVFW